MLKSDKWIRAQCTGGKTMIEPFVERQDGAGKISFGLSSYGYDIRVADEYKIFTNVHGALVDPKKFDAKSFVDVKGPECIVPPNSFALARTLEKFDIPREVLAVCLGKSTYARCGIIINVTPLEPGWKGYLTLEISNTTPLPAKIYSGEGIAQLLFLGGDQVCETAYSDRKGKYMDQEKAVVLPRILAKQ
jgi:dCTP deaminase